MGYLIAEVRFFSSHLLGVLYFCQNFIGTSYFRLRKFFFPLWFCCKTPLYLWPVPLLLYLVFMFGLCLMSEFLLVSAFGIIWIRYFLSLNDLTLLPCLQDLTFSLPHDPIYWWYNFLIFLFKFWIFHFKHNFILAFLQRLYVLSSIFISWLFITSFNHVLWCFFWHLHISS